MLHKELKEEREHHKQTFEKMDKERIVCIVMCVYFVRECMYVGL